MMAIKTKSDAFQAMGFQPLNHQRQVADAPHLIRACRWGRRSGAATLAAAELAATMLLKPGANCMLVSPTKGMAYRYVLKLRSFLQSLEVGRHIHITSADYDPAHTQIWLSNGSHFRIEDAQSPDDIADTEIDFLVLTDYFQLEPWVLLQHFFPPVVFARGKCLVTGTPMRYHDWAEREWKAQKSPDLWFFSTAISFANSIEFPDGENSPEIAKLKNLMSRDDYQRTILAEVPAITPRKKSPLKMRDEDRELFIRAVEDWLEENFGGDN